MRCTCCGQKLDNRADACPRCGADQTRAAKTRRTLISIAYAAVAVVLVSLLIFAVLAWHESQINPMLVG